MIVSSACPETLPIANYSPADARASALAKHSGGRETRKGCGEMTNLKSAWQCSSTMRCLKVCMNRKPNLNEEPPRLLAAWLCTRTRIETHTASPYPPMPCSGLRGLRSRIRSVPSFQSQNKTEEDGLNMGNNRIPNLIVVFLNFKFAIIKACESNRSEPLINNECRVRGILAVAASPDRGRSANLEHDCYNKSSMYAVTTPRRQLRRPGFVLIHSSGAFHGPAARNRNILR